MMSGALGSESGSPHTFSGGDELLRQHPSDVRRLQRDAIPAGYRDGITVAKATSIQAGFDEGFGLGATIGAQIGKLLGLLEGIASALKSEADSVAAPARAMLEEARKELSVQQVFSPTYWESDGTWKYEVSGADADEADVASSGRRICPSLVRKWTAAVQAEIEKWGIDLEVLAADEEDQQKEAGQEHETTQREITVAGKAKDALAW